MTDGRRKHRRPNPHSIGNMIGGAIGHAFGSVGSVGWLVGSALHLPGLTRRTQQRATLQPGARPGIEHAVDSQSPPPPGTIRMRCIDYSPQRVHAYDVDDLDAFLAEPRPGWAAVRWINIDGLHPYVINRVREVIGMHTLAAEDALHVPQRPRLELYNDDLFIIARMLRLVEDKLVSEQISLFVKEGLVVTFQEMHGDVWQPIRDRINIEGSMLRKNDPSYLIYALLDAVVDHCFPILERYGDLLEKLEYDILLSTEVAELHRIHAIKHELSVLRRVLWPTREVLDSMRNTELSIVSDITRTYLRDVYEHTVQIVEIIETFREMAGGLTDLHMSAMSNRMNETMKVLTIMATLFIPITFLAGVYGMNFKYIPEFGWRFAYPVFWGVCLVNFAGLLWYFRHKGWIGKE